MSMHALVTMGLVRSPQNIRCPL